MTEETTKTPEEKQAEEPAVDSGQITDVGTPSEHAS